MYRFLIHGRRIPTRTIAPLPKIEHGAALETART